MCNANFGMKPQEVLDCGFNLIMNMLKEHESLHAKDDGTSKGKEIKLPINGIIEE